MRESRDQSPLTRYYGRLPSLSSVVSAAALPTVVLPVAVSQPVPVLHALNIWCRLKPCVRLSTLPALSCRLRPRRRLCCGCSATSAKRCTCTPSRCGARAFCLHLNLRAAVVFVFFVCTASAELTFAVRMQRCKHFEIGGEKKHKSQVY